MSGNTGVPGSACYRFPVLVWNVLSCFTVSVPLCQTEIYYITQLLFLNNLISHQEIVRLYVSVDEVCLMQQLYPREYLFSEHTSRFQTELPITLLEYCLERLTEHLNDHDSVVSLDTEPVYLRNTTY
jgi:hypothetical protein